MHRDKSHYMYNATCIIANMRLKYPHISKVIITGVENFSFSLGLALIFIFIFFIFPSVMVLMSVPFGMYCLMSLLVFSTASFGRSCMLVRFLMLVAFV